jgi:nucleoside-diphosphate-sugar epimerase
VLGESLCLTASRHRASVARLSSVYSDDEKASGFLSELLRRLKKEKNFVLDSNSGAVRDYIHVDDAVKGILYLAKKKRPGIMNIASGENLSNQDIADALGEAGHSISFTHQTDHENAPACDIRALKSAGINPVPLRTYLKEFIHAAC